MSVEILLTDDIMRPPRRVGAVDDLIFWLMQRYPSGFPTYCYLFNDRISAETQLRIESLKDIDRLRQTGRVHVVEQPQGALAYFAAAVGIQAGVAILGMKLQELMSPKPFRPQPVSPNNQLSDRTNRARIGGMIAQIWGEVISVPDLIQNQYYRFENNQQEYHTMLLIGDGEYKLEDWKDGETPAEDIAGLSINVYKPGFSSNNTTDPDEQVGATITEPIYGTEKSKSVDGQQFRAPNAKTINSPLAYKFPDEILLDPLKELDFESYFAVDDVVTLTVPVFTLETYSFDLSADYTIVSVTSDTLAVDVPPSVQADWNQLTLVTDQQSKLVSSKLERSEEGWIGPFDLTRTQTDRVLFNLEAPEGLWKIAEPEPDFFGFIPEPQQEKVDIDFEVELTELEADGEPAETPNIETFTGTMEGSSRVQSARKFSLECNPTWQGRTRCRIKQTTEALQPKGWQGELAETVYWDSLFGLSRITDNSFGPGTTARVQTRATSSAGAIEDNKITVNATRKIPALKRGSAKIPSTLTATNRAAEVFCAVCLDENMGRRDLDELDVRQIFDTVSDIEEYFGTSKITEIGITYDDEEELFEQALAIMARSFFCTAYRFGTKIRITFDKWEENSVMLFNHRNIIPGSVERSFTFGNVEEYDGVELDWFDPDDNGEQKTFYVPENESFGNPKPMEVQGIRSKLAARFHAYREYNRIIHQHELIRFQATETAELLVAGDRIQVADRLVDEHQDGHVVKQDGLTVTLSQPVEIGDDDVIFLQLSDRSVQSMPVTACRSDRQVVLGGVPRKPLVTGSLSSNPTLWWIGTPTEATYSTWMVQEKRAISRGTFEIEAVNDSEKYYANDKDFINGVVDEEGNVL